MFRDLIYCTATLLAWLLIASLPASCLAGVPVLYSTDLYHPHDDPDDHYDLATLFALPELEVKGIIIDMSNIGQIRTYQQAGKRPGLVAVQQMIHLTGRKVQVAVGLDQPMSSPDDQALQQSDQSQAAVQLILATLAAADEKVCIFTVGSLRDVAVAYNRDPQLMRAKVRAIYANAGTGPGGYQTEWNVLLDPMAYRRVLLSDLPICWYPCFGEDGYRTYFRVDQTEVVGSCSPALQAYFQYALTRSQEDPITYLARSCPAPTGPRNMWCTPSFIDLAGRRIYRTSRGFEALAAPPSPDAKPVNCYEMLPVRLSMVDQPAQAGTAESGVSAHYVGSDRDMLGKHSLEPDGLSDCQVAITGLAGNPEIQKAELVGPREGIWYSYQNPRRWLLKTQWQENRLDLFFSYWAAGRHELTLFFADGSKQSVAFDVPPAHAPCFQADLQCRESNVHVIRSGDPGYSEVMASCLKNILASFPATAAKREAP